MATLLGVAPRRMLEAMDATPTPVAGPSGGARFTGGHLLSTWNHGLVSNAEGWRVMTQGGTALDAVVDGTALVESDPTGTSVGIGGRPDHTGKVTLDACVAGTPPFPGACGTTPCVAALTVTANAAGCLAQTR